MKFVDFLIENKIEVKIIRTDSGKICFTMPDVWVLNDTFGTWDGVMEYEDCFGRAMLSCMNSISEKVIEFRTPTLKLRFDCPKLEL